MVVWQGCPIVFSASEIWASCHQLCPTGPACPGFIGRSAVWQLPLGGGAPRCGTAREAWAGGGPAPRAGGGSGLVCVCLWEHSHTHPQRRGKICTPSLGNIRTGMWSVPFLEALSNNTERNKVESRVAYGLEVSLCISRLCNPGPLTSCLLPQAPHL